MSSECQLAGNSANFQVETDFLEYPSPDNRIVRQLRNFHFFAENHGGLILSWWKMAAFAPRHGSCNTPQSEIAGPPNVMCVCGVEKMWHGIPQAPQAGVQHFISTFLCQKHQCNSILCRSNSCSFDPGCLPGWS